VVHVGTRGTKVMNVCVHTKVHVGCELNETVITSFYIFTTFVRVTFLLGTYFYISTLLCYCGHVPHLNLNAHFLWL